MFRLGNGMDAKWILFGRYLLSVYVGLIIGGTSASTASAEVGAFSRSAKNQFCAGAAQDSSYFLKLALDLKNQLSFVNHGGLLDGGVCWWHSQFQRNSLYLAVFRPDLPRPTHARALQLIFQIRQGRAVTEIPGYSNLREFSWDFRDEIENKLEDWQLTDGFLKQKWIHNLVSANLNDPLELQRKVENLYSEVRIRKRITFVYLKADDIGSHALLITNVQSVHDGYKLTYIDSNFPLENRTYTYQFGDLHLYLNEGRMIVIPYLGMTGDFKYFSKAVTKYCGPSKTLRLASQSVE